MLIFGAFRNWLNGFKKWENLDMNYIFKDDSHMDGRTLICPKCHELLYRTDIEHFITCPYCSYPLEMTSELEDFLLEPIVDIWTVNEQQRML